MHDSHHIRPAEKPKSRMPAVGSRRGIREGIRRNRGYWLPFEHVVVLAA
jgi:hypothetical protein